MIAEKEKLELLASIFGDNVSRETLSLRFREKSAPPTSTFGDTEGTILNATELLRL